MKLGIECLERYSSFVPASLTELMPTFADRYYDVRPKRSGWLWMAFALDRITPIGRGEADTKAEAERAAKACIVAATSVSRLGQQGGTPSTIP